MSLRVECKNSNCHLYFLSYFPWNFVHHKTIIYDYFIPGYDCAIVNYIDRYLY